MRKRGLKRAIDSFKAIDMLGSGMGFTVKDNDVFRTSFGALVSIIVYAIVAVYATNKVLLL